VITVPAKPPLPGTPEYDAMVRRVAEKGPATPEWRLLKVAALMKPPPEVYRRRAAA